MLQFHPISILNRIPNAPYLAPTLAGSIDAEALPLTGVSV